jgi:hypothetical protein
MRYRLDSFITSLRMDRYAGLARNSFVIPEPRRGPGQALRVSEQSKPVAGYSPPDGRVSFTAEQDEFHVRHRMGAARARFFEEISAASKEALT